MTIVRVFYLNLNRNSRFDVKQPTTYINHTLLTMRLFYNYLSGISLLLFVTFSSSLGAQEASVARQLNEIVLLAIQGDAPRPTVHARNLFHTSAAMYDAWAAYDGNSDHYLLGNTIGDFSCPFDGAPVPENAVVAQEMAMSFAVYRMVIHRFENSFGVFNTLVSLNSYMQSRGYAINNTSTDYINGGPAELGNYIAQEYIAFGFQDGSNEANNYANLYYQSVNTPILPEEPGITGLVDPNRWQTIQLTGQVDQGGNPISAPPAHLSAEWGNVMSFALQEDQVTVHNRDGNDYRVFLDPGPPAYIDVNDPSGLESFYKWNFLMVAVWQSHLSPDDTTSWDISPATFGNLDASLHPTTPEEYATFYNYFEGGTISDGRDVNPTTGLPYEPQMIKRGDYARILAEFWADGPDSYTPPGHWFEIMHHAVLDHPDFERRWMGEGEILSDLEYDVKIHFALSGAMHDAAISAWSIKGWYDYLRPVSAIRFMCSQGQCSDNSLPNFNAAGVPLIPGYVEVVEAGDELAGDNDEHLGKIKLYTWRGHDYVLDTEFDYAGVGWILGENWWPYQRPTFVTPPFSGYISGHSTFSRSAAELLTFATGDEYFPGGIGEFVAEQNEFLEFEEGPSEEIVLQWATYRDASDQCSLSRIWGGIHPPIDDIPGRQNGIVIGPLAFEKANDLFNSPRPQVELAAASQQILNISDIGNNFTFSISFDREMNTNISPSIEFLEDNPIDEGAIAELSAIWVDEFTFEFAYEMLDSELRLDNIKIRIDNAEDIGGYVQSVFLAANPYLIDTDRPEVVSIAPQAALINDLVASTGAYAITITFNEACDIALQPVISLNSSSDISSTFSFNSSASSWTTSTTFQAVFDLMDNNEELNDVSVVVDAALDLAGNSQLPFESAELITIDTRNPLYLNISVSNDVLNQQNAGNNALIITLSFDEEMNTTLSPQFNFVDDNPLGSSLFLNVANSSWLNSTTYQRAYNLINWEEEFFNINIQLQNVRDLAGNNPDNTLLEQLFAIDTKKPFVMEVTPSDGLVSDSEVGSGTFTLQIAYNEAMDETQNPVVQLNSILPIGNSLIQNPGAGTWLSNTVYQAVFNVNDENKEIDDIGVLTSFGKDAAGNNQFSYGDSEIFMLDTKNPTVLVLNANTYTVDNSNVGTSGFELVSVFDEDMLPTTGVELTFDSDLSSILSINALESGWINAATYKSSFNVANVQAIISDINVVLSSAQDMAGNNVNSFTVTDYFSINLTLVGISELSTLGVQLYPNPLRVGQSLNLVLKDFANDFHFRMIDSQGKLVMSNSMSQVSAGVHNIELPALSVGLYLINIQIDGEIATYRLVISN